MKLLIDENLSPRLVHLLADLYPDSTHVHVCGLGAADDAQIWDHAKSQGFVIVSKDFDYFERSILFGSPPKVIWLRMGNCTTRDIESVLRTYSVAIHHFETNPAETVLILP